MTEITQNAIRALVVGIWVVGVGVIATALLLAVQTFPELFSGEEGGLGVQEVRVVEPVTVQQGFRSFSVVIERNDDCSFGEALGSFRCPMYVSVAP